MVTQVKCTVQSEPWTHVTLSEKLCGFSVANTSFPNLVYGRQEALKPVHLTLMHLLGDLGQVTSSSGTSLLSSVKLINQP